MSARRAVALARYAFMGNLRTPYTWAGAGGFLGLSLLGVWASARAGDGWVVDVGLVADAAILAAVLVIRSGLIPQRTGGLRTYLRMNFVSPVEHSTGMILSLVSSWLLVCAGLFLTIVLLPGGTGADAAWQVTLFGLRTGLLLPFILLTEMTTDIDIPFFLPGIAFVGLLMVLVFTLGEVEALAVLAPPMAAHDYRTALPSLARLVTVNALGFGAILAGTWWRGR